MARGQVTDGLGAHLSGTETPTVFPGEAFTGSEPWLAKPTVFGPPSKESMEQQNMTYFYFLIHKVHCV